MRKLYRYLGLPLLVACGSVAACSSDPGPTDLAGQLEKDTGVAWTVYTDPRSNEVRFLAPKTPVQIGNGTPEEKARAFFARYSDSLHTSGKSDEIRMVGSATDARGGIHIRFAHFLPGTELPVFASGSTAHFTLQGAVYWLQTDFRADLADVDGHATVTKEAAIANAIAHVAASCGAVQGQPTASGTELGVLSDPDTHAVLTYRVSVSVESEGCGAPSVFVDAKSGAPLKIEEGAHSIQEPIVGGSRFFRDKDFRDVKPISITTVPGSSSRFQMTSDDDASTRVVTKSFATGGVIQTNDAAQWDASASAKGKGAAVDAHFHTREALKFLRPFASRFKEHARDGLVFPLSRDVDILVHNNSGRSAGFNAFASFDRFANTDTISFGDGKTADAPNALPFSAAYDVVAHELTHLITAHTSNLKYERESGALNESFSDVMGAAAEHARSPDDRDNFLIGEKLFLAGERGVPSTRVLRSMTAPRSVSPPSPDHTSDQLPCPFGPNEDNDLCGVHANSGIPNRAFSLIVLGGSVTRFVNGKLEGTRAVGVDHGIGWESATELTYWATTGLSATASFENAALAQIAEARFVGGDAAALVVACAWSAVGVPRMNDEVAEALGATLCKPPPPAPPPVPPPAPPAVNVCEGSGDALICDPLTPNSAVQCKGGVLTKPVEVEACADKEKTCKSVGAGDRTAAKDGAGIIVCE